MTTVTIGDLAPDGWEIVPVSERYDRPWLPVGTDPNHTCLTTAPVDNWHTHVLVRKEPPPTVTITEAQLAYALRDRRLPPVSDSHLLFTILKATTSCP